MWGSNKGRFWKVPWNIIGLRRKCWPSRGRRITCWPVKQFPGCCWCFSSFKTGQWSFLHFQFPCLCWGDAAWDCSLGSHGRTEVCVSRDWKESWMQKVPGEPVGCIGCHQQDNQCYVPEELKQIRHITGEIGWNKQNPKLRMYIKPVLGFELQFLKKYIGGSIWDLAARQLSLVWLK